MITDKKVYICSPLSAKTREDIINNMMKARYYMILISNEYACRAVAPHAFMPEFIDDNNKNERKLALDFGLSFLRLCDALVICGEIISPGMKGEIAMAQSLKIPVYHFKKIESKYVLINMDNISQEVTA